MTFAVFHYYTGPQYGLPEFHDLPWLSRPSGHPARKGESWIHTNIETNTKQQQNWEQTGEERTLK